MICIKEEEGVLLILKLDFPVCCTLQWDYSVWAWEEPAPGGPAFVWHHLPVSWQPGGRADQGWRGGLHLRALLRENQAPALRGRLSVSFTTHHSLSFWRKIHLYFIAFSKSFKYFLSSVYQELLQSWAVYLLALLVIRSRSIIDRYMTFFSKSSKSGF